MTLISFSAEYCYSFLEIHNLFTLQSKEIALIIIYIITGNRSKSFRQAAGVKSMAENEMLDVGSNKRYRRWKAALTNVNLAPIEVASILSDELLTLLKSKLRKRPLSVVLSACKGDPVMLQDAIESFKEISLARLVVQASHLCRSMTSEDVAIATADLLVEGLQDRASLQAGKERYGLDRSRQAEIRSETFIKLEECKPELIRMLRASLSGQDNVHMRITRRPRPSAKAVVSLSLHAH